MGEPLYRGAQRTLERALQERLKRLDELAGKMDGALAAAATYLEGEKGKRAVNEQKIFLDRWPGVRDIFSHRIEESLGIEDRRLFLDELGKTAAKQGKYLPTIRALTPAAVAAGERWLRHVVDGITTRTVARLNGEADKP